MYHPYDDNPVHPDGFGQEAQGFVAFTNKRNDFPVVQGSHTQFAYQGVHHPAHHIQDASIIDDQVIEKSQETFITIIHQFAGGHEKFNVPPVIVNDV